MYYLANLIVSRVGLSETIILIVAGGLGFVYLLLARSGLRFGGASWRGRFNFFLRFLPFGVAIPLLLSILAAVGGTRDFNRDMNLLQQAGAITQSQFLLMREHYYFSLVKLFFVGGASTFVLWVLMRRIFAAGAVVPSESPLAAAGKEKDAEPV